MEYKELWDKLPTDVSANLEFAKFVAQEEPSHSRYFWGEYSIPILKWIALTVYSNKPIEEVVPSIMAQYYFFVIRPIDEKNKPQYYQLRAYKGLNGLKLETWLKRNGRQHFVKEVKEDEQRENNTTDLLEFVDYETLLSLDCEAIELNDEELRNRERLRAAWESLTEKDKDVLHQLVIEKSYWKDAYEDLRQYIFPKDGKQVMEEWTDKRKQDALALMKARAIEHLIVKFNTVKRKRDEVH